MIVWDWTPDEMGDAMGRTDHSGTSWRLVAPAPHHAPTVASWSESSAQADAWVSMAHDPFPPRIVAGWWQVPYSTPWVLTDEEGIAVGYGEIWDDEDEDEIELAPHHRGSGAPPARSRPAARCSLAGRGSTPWTEQLPLKGRTAQPRRATAVSRIWIHRRGRSGSRRVEPRSAHQLCVDEARSRRPHSTGR